MEIKGRLNNEVVQCLNQLANRAIHSSLGNLASTRVWRAGEAGAELTESWNLQYIGRGIQGGQRLMWWQRKERGAEGQGGSGREELGGSLEWMHKMAFTCACGLYFLSTCFALPYFADFYPALHLPNHFLYNFAILLAIAHSSLFAARLLAKTATTFEVLTYLLTLAGCVLLGVTTLYQENYNQGAKFMISSFMLSVSNQLKIISILLPNNRVKTQRNRFMLELSCCMSWIIFFFGAVIREPGLQIGYADEVCPVVNLASGVVMSFSIFYMYCWKEEKESGYVGLENAGQLQ